MCTHTCVEQMSTGGNGMPSVLLLPLENSSHSVIEVVYLAPPTALAIMSKINCSAIETSDIYALSPCLDHNCRAHNEQQKPSAAFYALSLLIILDYFHLQKEPEMSA